MGRSTVLAMTVAVVFGCRAAAPAPLNPGERQALADTVATLFDSLVAVHQTRPDTALLARLYPAADTVLYVEGTTTHRFTGDSLRRRVEAAHRMVHEARPLARDRQVQLLDRDHAVATALWDVVLVDTARTTHTWRGPVTVVAVRRGGRWVIRTHRE